MDVYKCAPWHTCKCVHPTNHKVEIRQSVISDVSDQSPFYDFGKVHSTMNCIETVSNRPMVVRRPLNCTCVCRTSNVVRGNLVYIKIFNSVAIYIIFNTHVTMSYVVFSVSDNGIAKRTFATLLPRMLLMQRRPNITLEMQDLSVF